MTIAIDKPRFYSAVRTHLGPLRPLQVAGFERILDEWTRRGLEDRRWLAYMLATTWHETAAQMQPIREEGSEAYLRSKPYYPYVGEGLVQVTWRNNYLKFGATSPGALLEWPLALDALFRGMTLGMFTGHRLSDYFGTAPWDPRRHGGHAAEHEARRIINGTDRADLVAGYYHIFMQALGA